MMPGLQKPCPHCGATFTAYSNPVPTVDVVIGTDKGVILIKRKNPPNGWALPGGFIDYGETAEQAAIREAKEETGLDIELTGLLGVYSDPQRDSRQHTISTVFTARTKDVRQLKAGDDAVSVGVFSEGKLPGQLAFDHGKILHDYILNRSGCHPLGHAPVVMERDAREHDPPNAGV